ncbi:MAG: SDR family oxidoreductase [Nevskia sp.]
MTTYKTALITGASSGIGAAFASALAAQGVDLVLVARSEDRLRTLAGRLTREYGRNVQVIPMDLSRPGAGAALRKATDALDMAIDLLINNAGFGTVGAFAVQEPAREAEEIALNVGAVVDLAHAYLPGMVERAHGGIVNIASAAAFQPMPYMAVYAATKAFVYSFSDALWAECAGRGVHVMAVCPGPVDTGFFEATGSSGLRKMVPKGSMVTAGQVVEASLAGLAARRRLVVPGGLNKATTAFSALVPRALLTRVMARFMKR